ncbi:hypothetical protein [Alcanivorax sp. 1008]|uniref:hypothetical protein n=1 Tax=Alcanivorax sp. 1008 TaxID=2816853 RepID=UPI001E047931|nr:hypothetical protein [Alcanivorax sp. 1008]MCC1497714.1 hypothetical protein [Alcanivorax sp. 1008]
MTEFLSYPGTDIDIRLGDVVSYKPFLRKRVQGKVVYMPGESQKNSQFEYGDVSLWLIKLDDKRGSLVQLGYFPPDEVVPKSLKFISRGSPDE